MNLEGIEMADDSNEDLSIIRWADGPRVFGLRPSRLREKIRAGEIPAPFPLSASGRALGWTQQMVREHHEAMARLAAERAKPQSEPAGLHKARTETKKQKLTPRSLK
jgi:hypothetical protein